MRTRTFIINSQGATSAYSKDKVPKMSLFSILASAKNVRNIEQRAEAFESCHSVASGSPQE